ncbi:branched-chain amino acid ABC transporter permease [Halorubrum sp. Boch-26]|uniref:branched-chain amino acid ABC transporter permease n=1 Tax=Halorubrum sp. Boch-26 TaxID=2994426 RepID=UPI0024690D3B|nr:branched-chain amino acid ABC transporter permease [Halorubrum sp. Boch-26]
MDTGIQMIELLVDGISRGLVFALLGVGITVVFGLGGVLNLALGVFSVIAIILGVELLGLTGTLFAAIPIAVLAVALLGLAVDRSLLSLVYRSEGDERILLGIFTTLGLATFLDGLLFITYPSSYSLSSGISSLSVAGIQIRGSSIAVIGVAVAVFAVLYYFFSRTYLGGAMRTVLQDETGAILCGISPRRMRTYVFLLSTSIAGIAGILYSFTFEVSVATGFELTIYAIIVSIVGGVTSVLGAAIAGLLLGIVVTFTSAFVGAYISEIVLFGVAIAVLIVRPEQIK